jgi:hypothetical protein
MARPHPLQPDPGPDGFWPSGDDDQPGISIRPLSLDPPIRDCGRCSSDAARAGVRALASRDGGAAGGGG